MQKLCRFIHSLFGFCKAEAQHFIIYRLIVKHRDRYGCNAILFGELFRHFLAPAGDFGVVAGRKNRWDGGALEVLWPRVVRILEQAAGVGIIQRAAWVALGAMQAPAPSPEPAALALWRLDCGRIMEEDEGASPWNPQPMPVSCFLIRHGERYMLWDAGLSARALGDAHPTLKLDRTVFDDEHHYREVAVRMTSGALLLRMSLATELGKEAAQFGSGLTLGAEIARTDTLEEMAAKVASLEMLAIQETVASLDFKTLGRAVAALDKAERILLFGVGASHFVARDLHHKLFRVGRNAFLLADAHEAWSAALLSSRQTVAIGFSHSGTTMDTAKFIDIARKHGALTVAVTGAPDSRLAKAAHERFGDEVHFLGVDINDGRTEAIEFTVGSRLPSCG